MATDAMADGFRHYLEHCSQEMASQIIAALRQAGDRGMPHVAPTMSVAGSAVSRPQKKQRRKAKSDLPTGGPKRPLNSWMAYRKYYNRVLQGYTQKAISKCLTQMWKADPFTAKWALLAKAYSTVRGSGEKEDAPLDDFFEICADAVGVIPPEFYMGAMGWSLLPPLAGDSENVPLLVRDREPSLDEFDVQYTTTNLGVDELIKMCHDCGYGQLSRDLSDVASTHGSLTMASRPSATVRVNWDYTPGMTPSAPADGSFTINEVATDDSMSAPYQHQMLAAGSGPPTPVYESPSIMLAPAAGQVFLEQAADNLQETQAAYPHFDVELPQTFVPDAPSEDSWDAHTIDQFVGDFVAGAIDFDAYLNQ